MKKFKLIKLISFNLLITFFISSCAPTATNINDFNFLKPPQSWNKSDFNDYENNLSDLSIEQQKDIDNAPIPIVRYLTKNNDFAFKPADYSNTLLNKAWDFIRYRIISLRASNKNQKDSKSTVGTGWILGKASNDSTSYEYYVATNIHVANNFINRNPKNVNSLTSNGENDNKYSFAINPLINQEEGPKAIQLRAENSELLVGEIENPNNPIVKDDLDSNSKVKTLIDLDSNKAEKIQVARTNSADVNGQKLTNFIPFTIKNDNTVFWEAKKINFSSVKYKPIFNQPFNLEVNPEPDIGIYRYVNNFDKKLYNMGMDFAVLKIDFQPAKDYFEKLETEMKNKSNLSLLSAGSRKSPSSDSKSENSPEFWSNPTLTTPKEFFTYQLFTFLKNLKNLDDVTFLNKNLDDVTFLNNSSLIFSPNNYYLSGFPLYQSSEQKVSDLQVKSRFTSLELLNPLNYFQFGFIFDFDPKFNLQFPIKNSLGEQFYTTGTANFTIPNLDLNSGSSGSPLIDSLGNVIGIYWGGYNQKIAEPAKTYSKNNFLGFISLFQNYRYDIIGKNSNLKLEETFNTNQNFFSNSTLCGHIRISSLVDRSLRLPNFCN